MSDKELIKKRFSRAAGTYDTHAVVQRRIAANLAGLLMRFSPTPDGRLFEVGCGTGFLTRLLIEHLHPRFTAVNDLCEDMFEYLPVSGIDMKIAGDAERIAYPEHTDTIASCSTVQWFESLPGFFGKCAASLRTGGLLAVSTFGEQNMREIALTTGKSLRYHSPERLTEMLEDRFEVLHMSQQTIIDTFPSARDVLYHLKYTGVTGLGTEVWTRLRLSDFETLYNRQFAYGDGVRLTYNPIYFIARKK